MTVKSAVLEQALTLPVAERIELAQALWDSLSESERLEQFEPGPELLDELRHRQDDMASGRVQVRSHEEVMEAMRRATS